MSTLDADSSAESAPVDQINSSEPSTQQIRPQFGNRYLTNPTNVFKHNAWDNVEWDEFLEKEAQRKVTENSKCFVEEDMQIKYEEEAHRFWNDFYGVHQNRFFKDRHWLFTEFPELAPNLRGAPRRVFAESGTTNSVDRDSLAVEATTVQHVTDRNTTQLKILEIGCGPGNTVFPILENNNDPETFVFCCDFSQTAVDLVKSNPLYDERRCHVFVCDVTKDEWEVPFAEASLDIVILIFVLSGIHPDRMRNTVCQICKYLKPGGLILIRDYGRFDMAQLRFKSGRCLSDNFYVRGDGTRVFFFTQDDVRKLFVSAGLIEEQNLVDRRLQVNRGKQLKMYRVWIQGKYRKPS